MASRHLRLGTRRSALARAQSALIARELERLHPGLTVELIGIDTRGDRILDQPLSQVEGKEFFTAEIDSALQRGEVDLTVHSFKDLSLERPVGLHLAAVPRRENPRDIAVFAADVREQLARGAPLRIGSSSPRRAAFVPDFMQRALPRDAVARTDNALRVQLCELRGNVDSRLRRLREPRGAPRQLDGVVLALAGLARLWKEEGGGRALLEELLPGLPRMLLPLTACPAAPAQGALAIECRSDDARTRELLTVLDHADTRRAVAAERQLLAQRGGGCHQRFGATQLTVPGLGTLLHTREAEPGTVRAEVRWQPAAPLPPPGLVTAVWDGSQQPSVPIADVPHAAQRCAAALANAPAGFIAHRRALPGYDAALTVNAVGKCAHIWVPGTETWFALAERGVWVEGCAEGLGFETLQATLAEPVLQLPALNSWLVLTHEAAAAGWGGELPPTVLATYRHLQADHPSAEVSPLAATHIYWHSAAQFERWADGGRAKFALRVHHACAFGKTAGRLRSAGVSTLTVFPSAREWREWLQA